MKNKLLPILIVMVLATLLIAADPPGGIVTAITNGVIKGSDLNFNNFKGTNAAPPTELTDIATKEYVDTHGGTGGGSGVDGNLIAGTGIGISGTWPDITISNTVPPGNILAGTGISVTGTWPNLTIGNTGPTIASYQTVTPAGTVFTAIASSSKVEQHHVLNLTANSSLAFSGVANGMSGIVEVNDGMGTHTLSLPSNSIPSTIAINGGGTFTSKLAWSYDGSNYLWTQVGGSSATGDNGTATGLSLTVNNAVSPSTLTLGGILNVASGGTGNAAPALVAGANTTISGAWPNQTIASTGSVFSVSGSGGSTGLTLTGGPITGTGTLTVGGILAKANGGTGLASPSLVQGLNDPVTVVANRNISVTGTWPNQSIGFIGKLPVDSGGTGTDVPSLVAGTNTTVSGTWPNQAVNVAGIGTGTVTSAGLSTNAPFLTVGSSPITTSGTITLNLGAGVVPPANLGSGSLGTGTKVLYDDGTYKVPPGAGAGTGSVTSIDMAAGNSLFSFTGGPVTTSGTITLGLGAGKVPQANLGTGSLGTGTKALYDDQTYKVPPQGTVTLVTGDGGSATGLTLAVNTATTTPSLQLGGILSVVHGGTGSTTSTLTAGTNTSITGSWPNQTVGFSGVLPVASGGTGTATPALVAGANTTLSGTWPNVTIASTGTVTSVAASGGTTGLSFTGTPVTSNGTLILGGILAKANGGNGTATPAILGGANIGITGAWPAQTVAFSGTLPLANGGTGGTTQQGARSGIGAEAQSTQGTFTDSGTTSTPTVWTDGVTTFKESVALATTNRYSVLPLASSFRNGRIITYIDPNTVLNYGRIFRPQGSDTVNGTTADIAPFIAGGAGGLTGTAMFESDGVSDWRMLFGNLKATAFVDPLNAGKRVDVNVSLQTPNAGYTFFPSSSGDSGSVANLVPSAHTFVTGFDVPSGTLSAAPIYFTDVLDSQDQVTETTGTHTVDNSGTKNEVWIDSQITAPITVVWPPASAYSPGERVTIYDAVGGVGPVNTVTITSASGNTFNNNTSFVFSEPFFSRTLIASPATGSWSVPTQGGSTGTGLNVGGFVTLGDAVNVPWVCDQSLNRQKANLTLNPTYGLNRIVTISNARPGEEGELWVTHGQTNDTVTFNLGGNPNNGLSVLDMSTTTGAIDRVQWILGPNNKFAINTIKNTTWAAPLACTNPGDVSGATGVSIFALAGTSSQRYFATRRVFSAAVCRLDINLVRIGSPAPGTTVTAYLYNDGALTNPTDGVTNSTATVTSTTANFDSVKDLHLPITGSGIPAGSYIGIVNSATSIGLSSSATVNTPVSTTSSLTGVTLTFRSGPGNLVATSTSVDATAAGPILTTSTVTRFDFPSSNASGIYYVGVSYSGAPSTSNTIKAVYLNASGGTYFYDANGVAPWTAGSGTGALRFTAYN